MLIVIDPGHGGINIKRSKYWEKRICLQCGKEFLSRKCYIKRGQSKFCSKGCGVSYRNINNNPAKREDVRIKISLNHTDVSGKNNPMYGRKGKLSPGYIDGRRIGSKGEKLRENIWRCIALKYKKSICEICDKQVHGREKHIHHKDKNRKNNSLDNLQVVCVRCHNLILHKQQRDNFGRFIKEVV